MSAKTQATKPRLIYVLGNSTNTRIKVGFSTDVQRRLVEIQRMSPVQLTILATWPGGRLLESELHRAMRDYRIYGEWFDFGEGVDAVGLVGDLLVIVARSIIDQAIEQGLVTTAEELTGSCGTV